MSALATIRRVLAEYRAEFGLSRTYVGLEFASILFAMVFVLTNGWWFAAMTP